MRNSDRKSEINSKSLALGTFIVMIFLVVSLWCRLRSAGYRLIAPVKMRGTDGNDQH